jgi:hypothetical protein
MDLEKIYKKMINDLKNQEASGMEVSPNNSRCRNFAIRW